ncbi:hypothetical protein ANO11243_049530 [Dothideomycetidae sp. 11243]|nr:hypothetical protein ANO11243_049530 [fungal sp. No.11243]
MAPKVLFVLTSHDTIPANGKPTGWYLPEFAHPWEVLHNKVDITIASPKGGEAPLDQGSVEMFKKDDLSMKFLKEQESLWKKTEKLSDFVSRVSEFDAIFYVGGHGPMFDLYSDKTSLELIQKFAESKKIVSAVCHGPAALIKATTAKGEPLLHGAEVTGFSDTEEDQVGLTSAMPYSLEGELNKASNGSYVKAAEPWGEKVTVSTTANGATLITGQNPSSAGGVGEAILKALKA